MSICYLNESEISCNSQHMIVLYYDTKELLTKWQIIARMVSGIKFIASPKSSPELKVYNNCKLESIYNGNYEIPDIIGFILNLKISRNLGLSQYCKSI